MVYIYNEGDVTYQEQQLKADYMQIDMNSKLIHAYGKPDSLEGKAIVTKPNSPTAKPLQDGHDHLQPRIEEGQDQGRGDTAGRRLAGGGSVKKMPDNTINIENGKYTTCDETDHPHFYLAMTKAKVIPRARKVVTRPAYLVIRGRADLFSKH